MEAKIRRQQAMVETRRAMVLDAARTVFSNVGLERASMREIAKQAGYTPGALYSYYSGKQELLAALLYDMLKRLQEVIQQAKPARGRSESVVFAKGQAWLAFFISQPREMELALSLLVGAGTQRVSPDISRALHGQVRKTLDPIGVELLVTGATPGQVDVELEALLAQGLGLLLTQDTNRLHTPEQSPEALFANYLQDLEGRFQLTARSEAASRRVPVATPQVDLFGQNRSS